MKKEYIIPIFVPHLGCPHQCTFCNQKEISGQTKQVTANDVKETIEYYLKNFKDDSKYVEVAFYGGSFTAIDEGKQNELLEAANEFIKLEKANNRKIWLKCGGFITIDKTEALTAIDVNSGKYVGTKDLEKTIFTVNKEATIEITKQIRLRDIGGIIIIDYIDMENKEDKAKILEILEENLKKDRSKTQVIGFTPLDLLEMTRKHMWSND